MGRAANIACGARSPGFWTEDEGRVEWLRGKVEEGVCVEEGENPPEREGKGEGGER